MDSRPAFLPYSLLFLNISSLLLCIVIFILSLFNLTVLSVWINAGCALLSFIFHLSTFIIAWRKMSKRHAEQELRNAFSDVPSASGTTLRKQNTANDSSSWVMESYSSNALVGIYILLISWIIIFGIVIQSSISAPVTPSEINTNAGGPSLRVFNMVLIGIEIIVMGWLAIHYASIVRRINHKEILDADADFFDFSRSNTLRSIRTRLSLKRKSSFGVGADGGGLKRKSSFFMIVQPPPPDLETRSGTPMAL